MASPVTRDEFTKLGERVTAVEMKNEDLATKVDRGFAEIRENFRVVHKDLGTLRRDILGLNDEMGEVQKRLDHQDKVLASHTKMHVSHTTMLEEILRRLDTVAPG